MRLELEDGTVFERPSERDIEQAIDTLGRHGNSFAILMQDAMTYIQTAGSRDTGYRLEYQAEDTDHHYGVVEPVSHEEVVAVFNRYAKGDMSWKEDYSWTREEIGAPGGWGCMGVVSIMLVLVFVVARLIRAAWCG